MNLSFGKCNMKRLSEKAGMGIGGRNEGNVGNDGMWGIRVEMWGIGVEIIFQISL